MYKIVYLKKNKKIYKMNDNINDNINDELCKIDDYYY